jgi:hypothetical protein
VVDTFYQHNWKKISFVQAEQLGGAAPSAASQPERSPTLDFIDGFARFERSIREILRPYLQEGETFTGSTLDFAMKALSNSEAPPLRVIQGLPKVYKLRNRTIHGDEQPSDNEVGEALLMLDQALASFAEVSPETLERAFRATTRGLRGTRLPTRLEEAQEAFEECSDDGVNAR